MKQRAGAKADACRHGADATRNPRRRHKRGNLARSVSQPLPGARRDRSDLGAEADGVPDLDGTEEAVAALAAAGTRGA